MTVNESVAIGRRLGQNLRQWREARGMTQREAAVYLRQRGLRWTHDHLASLESGRRQTIEIESLVLLAFATQVRLPKLLGNGLLDLGGGIAIRAEELQAALAGRNFRLVGRTPAAQLAMATVYAGAGIGTLEVADDVDVHAAKRLGMDVTELADAARQRWGHSLAEERDRRLGKTAGLSAATLRIRRGHITRALLRELQGGSDGK